MNNNSNGGATTAAKKNAPLTNNIYAHEYTENQFTFVVSID